MSRTTWIGVVLVASLALVIACSPESEETATAPESALGDVPTFEVDPSWPTISDEWVLGFVASVAVDSRDHVWVLQRPGSLGPEEASMAAPPVLEFDPEGKFQQGWGGPNTEYHWPESEHGIYVDHNDFVWVGGNGADDNQVLKFTTGGEFVMQIGRSGESRGNGDTENLGRPADVWVHPPTNELFVADGYGNRRVIVYDADTGEFKRMWGAFGNEPTDGEPDPSWATEQEGAGPPQFSPPVHAAKVSNDGLVYVSDRAGKRVQVFTTEGEYVSQVFIGRDCLVPECGNGTTAASTAFSSDPEQRFLYVGNRSQAQVMVLERETLEILYGFGRWGSAPGEFGTLHHMDVDSKGNLYVSEVTPLDPVNRRVQKFVFAGMRPRSEM
jgi:DNA-binding beta-propeller fold protein YncE